MRNIFNSIKIGFYYVLFNPLFIIKIKDGKVFVVKGSLRNSFVRDCQEIIKQNSISSGIVYAQKGQYGESLLYGSTEIKKEILQQFRNAWNFNK